MLGYDDWDGVQGRIERFYDTDNYGVYLWDNLFAQYIKPTNLKLRQEIVVCIKLVELLMRIDAATNTSLYIKSDILDWEKARVLLPHEVFPIPGAEYDMTLTPIEEAEPEEVDIDRINKIRAAIKELNKLHRNQIQDNHLVFRETGTVTTSNGDGFPTEIIGPDPELNFNILREEYASEISSNTIDLLTEVGITGSINVINATERLEEIMRESVFPADIVAYTDEYILSHMVMKYDDFCEKEPVPAVEDDDPCANVLPSNPWPDKTVGFVSNIGVGDLMVMEKRWQQYQMGEIAHVENILASEHKERVHKRTDRIEETFETESERTTEDEHDTQTNERFQLDKETANEINSNSQTSFGIAASAAYGTVKVSGDFRQSNGSSVSTSDRNASSFAKEVVSRSISRVKERIRTLNRVVKISQVEETNTHGFDNSAGSDNISGIYRYLNEKYECTLRNYGKRLMLEFVVPEPASFYIYSKINSKAEGVKVQKPESPSDVFKSIFGASVNPNDASGIYGSYERKIHLMLGDKYGAKDLTPPPDLIKTISKSFMLVDPVSPTSSIWHMHSLPDKTFEIPSGYKAVNAKIMTDTAKTTGAINIMIGFNYVKLGVGGQNTNVALSGETDQIPVSLYALNTTAITLNIEIECRPTDNLLEEWRMKTYNSIMQAYQQRLADYNDAIANAEANSVINGTNPGKNREVEKNEMKRRSLEIMTGQRFDSFSSIAFKQNGLGYPEIRFDELNKETDIIKFFEQGFEWEQMTYNFYPYFWGRKKRWIKIMQFNDDDPLFSNFLQAGAARVVVPVNPVYEDAVLHYLQTGEISSVPNPVVTSDYITYQNDLKKQDAYIVDQWVVSVPTNLVVLETDPAVTLPTNPDHELPL